MNEPNKKKKRPTNNGGTHRDGSSATFANVSNPVLDMAHAKTYSTHGSAGVVGLRRPTVAK
jgi:hypothetical protein